MLIARCFAIVAALIAATHAVENTTATASDVQVDLGYSVYGGYHDDVYDLNVWKGIRYAAPPTGSLRWQAPQQPILNRSGILDATQQPPVCPQTGGFGLPDVYGFTSGYGDEDCLFLNVWAAPNASALPVLIWIHGGGYSKFGALYDPSVWIDTNEKGFVVVEIQYRLGAFGFLSSDDIRNNGMLNVGLLDQRFAFDWVQKYISKFGGDPTHVTIGGESSGAGSVLYHVLARGGFDSEGIYENAFTASPWLPPIHEYSDPVPTSYYDDFVTLAGCRPGYPIGHGAQTNSSGSTFECLVNADTLVLQNASGTVSTTHGYYGSFAFLPVIDHDYIQTRPLQQLRDGKVNGKRILVGNNANEGVPLTNPNVDSLVEYNSFIANTFPLFTPSDIATLNITYQIASAQEGDSGPRFDTLGDSGPTALTMSEMATGLQQTVFNMAAESLFSCPAQWLAQAFSNRSRQAWKYQYSVTPAYHGADLGAYFAVNATVPNADFRYTFQKILGNFIMHNSPVVAIEEASVGHDNATIPAGVDGNINWPQFSPSNPSMMNLNTTGGSLTQVVVTPELSYYERYDPGIVNDFRLVDALTWEGGRGRRCDFWESVSERIPY